MSSIKPPMPPLISVVVPTYNGGLFVNAALESIAAQSPLPCDIIVVDDASTDDTLVVVSEFASRSSVPVRIVRLEKNSGGPAHPINLGVDAATGDLVAVLDQDDCYLPETLSQHATLLATDDTLGASVTWCAVKANERCERMQEQALVDAVLSVAQPAGANHRLMGREALRLFIKYSNFVVGYPGVVFRRELWARKGGVNENYRIASDFDLLCWLASQGPIGLVPRVGYVRREHESNLHRVMKLVTQMDVARIKAHYLRNDAVLRRDAELCGIVSSEVRGVAYRCRECGRYADALRFLAMALVVGGTRTESTSALLKLAPHWSLRTLRRLVGSVPRVSTP